MKTAENVTISRFARLLERIRSVSRIKASRSQNETLFCFYRIEREISIVCCGRPQVHTAGELNSNLLARSLRGIPNSLAAQKQKRLLACTFRCCLTLETISIGSIVDQGNPGDLYLL